MPWGSQRREEWSGEDTQGAKSSDYILFNALVNAHTIVGFNIKHLYTCWYILFEYIISLRIKIKNSFQQDRPNPAESPVFVNKTALEDRHLYLFTCCPLRLSHYSSRTVSRETTQPAKPNIFTN